MPSTAVILAILTAFSMAGGQMLFKLGAASVQGNSTLELLVSFVRNPFLVGAAFLYALTIVVWVFVLRILPLSLAYPLTALSYVIVPVLSYLFLQEKISWQTAVGAALIIAGVIVTHARGA
ncbi:MAG TPA: EamA family transporter [Pseudomonadales bacterium]|nr:EamA family transporter [Pseudomonadales bacterium]